jgi:dTDP-glucose 4,6-dehydratase
LHGRPITVFKGHTRTSTYIYDCVRTLANIIDNFKSGEVYNISSSSRHSIEELVEMILQETGADSSLVHYDENHEILTTKHKIVDSSKSKKDLKHQDTVSLEQGVRNTVQWMKKYYKV